MFKWKCKLFPDPCFMRLLKWYSGEFFALISHNLISMHSIIIMYLLVALQNNWSLEIDTPIRLYRQFISFTRQFLSSLQLFTLIAIVYATLKSSNLTETPIEQSTVCINNWCIFTLQILNTNTSANTSQRENGRTGERKWNREREKKNGRKKYNVLLFDEYMDQKASIALAKASTRLCMPM